MTDPKPAVTMREITDALGHTTPGVPRAEVQATRYEVSILPEGDINRHLFTINVEYRGDDRWAAARHGQCLNAAGEWSYELRASERDDDWLDEHRFDLGTAIRLAKKAAPHLRVNGHTAVDAYKRTHPSPCGPAPQRCDGENGEPCANHEREQAHAEGEHCFCGPECTAP